MRLRMSSSHKKLTSSLDYLPERLRYNEGFTDPPRQLVVNSFWLVAHVDKDEHRPVVFVANGTTWY